MIAEYILFGLGRLVFAIRGRLHGAYMDDTFRIAYIVIAVLVLMSILLTIIVFVRQFANIATSKLLLFVAAMCHIGALFARAYMQSERGWSLHPLDVGLGILIVTMLLYLRINMTNSIQKSKVPG